MAWTTALHSSTLVLGSVMSLVTSAQTVFIPDTHLRAQLSLWAPGAVDSDGFLDPQHPSVLAKSWLSVEAEDGWDPVDLTGLEALDQLDSLYVTFIHQDGSIILASFDTVQISVPAWPSDLTKMSLRNGTYTSLPAWPAGLATLDYELPSGPSSLPALPATLTELRMVVGEALITMPDLPEGLQRVTLTGPTDLEVPALPMSITELIISGFGPTGVTAWPDALQQITITAVPTWSSVPVWPPDLGDLSIQSANDLTTLPAWPNSLTKLSISSCSGITSLPGFNSGLVDISLSSLGALTALPDYPATVEELQLGGLSVTALPEWPPLVEHIRIGQTMPNLLALPDFPADVRYITITGDLPTITALPSWPDSLRELTLYSVSIDEIPALPSHITALQIADLPNLQCLPFLPPSLSWFYNMVPGLCLPNMPAGLSHIEVAPDVGVPVTTSMLCNVLNSTCDFLNPVATGTVYWDQNANGVRDGGEPGYPFSTINAQPGNITYGVPSIGDYALPLPFDQYTLTASSSNPYVQSISPASHGAPFMTSTDVDTGNDFGVVLQPDVQDLNIDLMGPWGRPGFETPGGITCANIGSTEQPCTVIFQLDANQSWVSSDPAPTSVNGNTVTWDIADLGIGQTRHISFTVYTDVTVPLGTQLVHTAAVGDPANDETPEDNSATSIAGVDGSWDPNDKRVEPATLGPVEVLAGEELIYTIRFQNTGTYQADRVIITDQLSEDLQWNTMRFINSSHPCTWVLSGDGLLRFTFEPIFLPDSTSDEPNSHGHVRFAMKPVSDLMLGESVGNIANIYFDYNEPVITNEAVFTVEQSTGIAAAAEGDVRLWPNPAEHVLYVEGAANTMIEITDVTGRILLRHHGAGDPCVVDVAGLAPGGYALRVKGRAAKPFVKR